MKKAFRILFCISCICLLVIFSAPGGFGLPQATAQEYVPDLTPMQVSADGSYSYKVYSDGSVVIEAYNGQDQSVVIPAELDGNRVTAVGADAFSYYEMKSLTVPEGVDVSGRAFQYCEIEDAISLPAGITVSVRAFEYAKLPNAVVIPEGAMISGNCFSYCEGLETLFVAPGATLKGDVFSYSEDLETVICASGSTFAEDAFYDCDELERVVLCGDVTLEGKPFPYSRRAEFISADEAEYTRNLEAAFPSENPSMSQGRIPVIIEGKSFGNRSKPKSSKP